MTSKREALIHVGAWRDRLPSELPDELFSELRALHDEVDAATKAFEDRYGDDVACKAGCSECCRSFFEVGLADGLYLLRGLAAKPAQQRASDVEGALRAVSDIGDKRQQEDPFQRPASMFIKDLDVDFARSLPGVYCALLTEGGACSIYSWRPVVCRYYGYPRLHPAFPDQLDYCYLNFRELRAAGEEPDKALAMDVAGWRARLDTIEGRLAERVFGERGLRYSSPIAEYVASAGRTLGDWQGMLAPMMSPVFIAVRRFFEVLGARDEARRHVLDPYALDRSSAWAETQLTDPALADDLDTVVNACLDRLSGESIDARAVARVLQKHTPEFRRHALLVSLQVAQEAAGG